MIRFQLLGPVTAHSEHGSVPLGSARQRTVLAALLTDLSAAVTLDQLVDRVWGVEPPQRYRETMHTYLSRLRSLLSDVDGPALIRRTRSYAIEADPATVDLHRFRMLAEQARREPANDRAANLWSDALGLWQGTPFAGLDSEWLRATATALEAEQFGALLDRNDVLLRLGEHTLLLPGLTAAATERPLDERLTGQLMLALYRSGRQADALAHYRQVYERLVEELGSDPCPALQELHQHILRQDPKLTVGTPARPANHHDANPVADAPAQLPADIAGFIGRDDALKQLDSTLDGAGDPPANVVISTIGGIGGIGKTALAVHWAHRVRDRFPDGQIYLNLRGFDPGGQALSPGTALRTMLELLGVPVAKLPATMEAQAGLYRGRLANARMLLLLDNARDAEQIRPLLPGSPGSMVLVTSRSDLASLVATGDARPLWLDRLDPDGARLLLARRLGAGRLAVEPEAVEAIVEACAGLPLALAIVAARVATRPGLPLSALAAKLSDMEQRLDALGGPDPAADVRSVFSWSYHALGTAAARLFRLLGLHPGPDVGLGAAASLAGLPPRQARRLLDELAAAHLLAEHAPGRYAFHDLIRAYAAELARTDSESDRLATQRRMLDHYLHSAHATDRWLPASRDPITLGPASPGAVVTSFTDNTGARQWLTDELPVLLALVDDTTDAQFDLHIQQLAWSMATFLLWRGLWHHQVTVQDAALRAARRLGDQSGQADIHRRLVYAHMMLGRREQAHEHSQEALGLYATVGDHTGQARTHLGLMWFFEQQGRHHDALFHAERCLEYAQLSGNRQVLALAYNAVGWTHTLVGDHEAAIANCEQALPILDELGERATMADVWDSLGHAYRHLGRYAEAIGYYQQAIDLCRELGDRRHEASHLVQLGETHEAAGDHRSARETRRAALALYDEIEHPDADSLRAKLATRTP